MKWHFINTGENTGKFNMLFDLLLTKVCLPDQAYFRLYRWKPYCISLGANQSVDSINSTKASANGINIVTRPTGGRAILHSEEITYSVVMPVENISSVREVYHEINCALKAGLELYNPLLKNIELESNQPDFQKFYKEEKSAVCFAVPAKSELKFNGKKLVGSAQRKIGNIILQHGSILTGGFHKKIVEYLDLNEDGFNRLKSEIENTTIELNSILDNDIDYDILSASLAAGFENYFETVLEPIEKEYLLNSTEVPNVFN